MRNVIIQRIATILEDMFGINASQVEPTDTFDEDWGIVGTERVNFEREFCAEFELSDIPHGSRTVEDYARLVS